MLIRKSFTINSLPKEERPREKMINAGVNKLSDRELIITLLGRGIAGESVTVTTERIFGRFRNLKRIANASVEDLSGIKGIGPAKATQIKAAFELGKRLNGNHKSPEPFIKWACNMLDPFRRIFTVSLTRYDGKLRRLIQKMIVIFTEVKTQNFNPCQSKNHTRHKEGLWQCASCKKIFCYEEGCDDEYFELCDDCWSIKTNLQIDTQKI